MFTLMVSAVTPEMVLWDDVYAEDNQLLLRANCVLDEKMIAMLKEHNVQEVNLMSAYDIGLTQFERINRSGDFKRFSAAHEESLVQCKKLINNLTKRIPIDLTIFEKLTEHILSTVKSEGQLLDFLSNMISNEYEMTYTHCLNSALLCHVFGNWLSYPPATIKNLILCGFLYDIGKIQLPYDLIWKTDKLTPDEVLQFRRHIHLGYDMLKDLNLPASVLTTLVMHHERCDGSGYPAGLTKEKLDSSALFIAIVDSYDAMTHPRVNRPALNPFQAIKSFEQEGLYKYDENLIKPILSKIANNYLHCKVLLNNNLTGVITEIHDDLISAPSIRCENMIFDLRTYKDMEIIRIM